MHSILVGNIKNKSISIPISFPNKESGHTKIVETNALIDCGAGGKFISKNFVKDRNIPQTPLRKPLPVYNVDRTLNKEGSITHYTKLDLKIGERIKQETLLVSGIGKHDIILGLPWLQESNPSINWKTAEIEFKEQHKPGQTRPPKIPIEEPDDQEWTIQTLNPMDDMEQILDDFDSMTISHINGKTTEEMDDIWINAKLSSSQEFAIKYDTENPGTVPPEYHEYMDVFGEGEADRLPKQRPWDHKIDMKPGFEPRSFKSYNLTPEEREQQELFISEQLKKDISDRHNHQWLPHSSSYQRRMANYDLLRTTDI